MFRTRLSYLAVGTDLDLDFGWLRNNSQAYGREVDRVSVYSFLMARLPIPTVYSSFPIYYIFFLDAKPIKTSLHIVLSCTLVWSLYLNRLPV